MRLSAACVVLAACLVPLVAPSHAVRHAGVQHRSLAQSVCDTKSYTTLTPTVTKAPVIDLTWLGATDQNVLAVTKKVGLDAGGLWQSTNGGSSWSERTLDLFSALSQLNTSGSISRTEPTEVVGVFSQKSNANNLVILGAGTYYWTSVDGGKSLAARQTVGKWRGMSIKSYKIHPKQDSWLLLLVKRPDCRATDIVQMECPHDLMLTQDLYSGNPSWRNLTADAGGKIAGFVDFDWQANLCPPGAPCTGPLASLDERGVFASMYEKPGDYDQPWDPDVHFVASSDWFTTYATHVRCGNMFEVIGQSIYLALANSCPTDITGQPVTGRSVYPQGITLYTSTDAGSTFVQACLPVALKQEGYELLETHDGTGAIVIVDFVINQNMPASSVYTAGPHHALFSLSLTDVYHADFGFATDFAKIEGLPGLYIANQMLPRPVTDSDDYYDLSDLTGQPLVETRISFTGGSKWQRLPAPTTFKHPACDRCGGQVENCFLHLHGLSSWDSLLTSLPAVYSNPSAPGLVMASGNVGVLGTGLDDNDGVCTWLSTDGGVSWSDVGVGTYIYEYADWGGVIIMARHPGSADQPADEVVFSYDGGSCWQRVPLAEALLVDNIRIEPDGQQPRVVVHGRRCRKSLSQPKCGYDADVAGGPATEGLMYLVDAKDLMHGAGLPTGACGSLDRELWAVPSGPSSATPGEPRCVLGRQSRVERKRMERQCLNGPDYKRPAPTNASCACSPELDFECDYGYMRSDKGTQCVQIPATRMPQCPVIAQQHYTVSSTGKRLLHSDTCTNPHSVVPDTGGKGAPAGDSPPSSPDAGGGGGGSSPADSGDSSSSKTKKHSRWFGFLMFLLVMCVLGGGFTAWWVYLATESQRDHIRDAAAAAQSLGLGVKEWVETKVRGRRTQFAEQDLGYFQPLSSMEGAGEDHRALFTLK